MNRNTRTLIVLLVAVAVAAIATFAVYRAIKRMPVREVEVAHSYTLVAAKALAVGARLSASDVKVVAWPARAPLAGAHLKPEEVVNRGVVAAILENEPVTEAKLAPLEAGAGLPPTIPAGMRAISVRVNEVIGVAGFVVPGTRVDVFATLKRQTQSSETRLVVGNVQVLTAGTRYDQEQARAGEAMPSSVVTLLLTPQDAERTVLAAAEGQLMLALRNPLDAGVTPTAGTRTEGLFGDAPRAEAPAPVRPKPVATKAPVMVAAAAPPPPPPAPYVVEAIRAAKRTTEPIH